MSSALKFDPSLKSLSDADLTNMISAGRQIHEAYRVLKKGGLNVVGECLKGQGQFLELEHYPKEDVFDGETFCQYYYHAHREDANEHGHFHTFIRAGAFPKSMKPQKGFKETDPWPRGKDAVAHVIAISMDGWGFPTGLFGINRWVTGETWYSAEDIIAVLDRFRMDHAYPSWPVNIWLTQMMILFRPQIEQLLRHRDQVINAAQAARPDEDVLEDRSIEITGALPINVDRWLKSLSAEQARRQPQQ